MWSGSSSARPARSWTRSAITAGGQFHFVHVATMDSKGNLYTGEVDSGKRVQKFVPVR
jgi:hypothetical protein